MKNQIKRIGVLTAGGDCPGLNAVIRAVTKTAIYKYGIEVIGFRDGYDGLINDDFVVLNNRDVSGILPVGGTILGTSNIANPYEYCVKKKGSLVSKDMSMQTISNYRRHELDALITIGGDGTLSTALKLSRDGLNIIGVPKTIDNDLSATELTFGFETAVVTATEAIDKLHSTAQSHHRAMLVEVMGRYAGWIALYSGVAGGGDVILIPEIPYDIGKICRKLEERQKSGKRFSIIVVAEGAKPRGGKVTVARVVARSHDKIRLGGVANKVGANIERVTGIETRTTVLGHVQRGGSPTPLDRILATRFGCSALELAVRKKFGRMVALRNEKITDVAIEEAVGKLKLVGRDHPMIISAKDMGISFGD